MRSATPGQNSDLALGTERLAGSPVRPVQHQRTLDEYGGDWSIARYIEAVETEDESAREEIMQEILDYNREDLEATWAVMGWLKSLA